MSWLLDRRDRVISQCGESGRRSTQRLYDSVNTTNTQLEHCYDVDVTEVELTTNLTRSLDKLTRTPQTQLGVRSRAPKNK